MIFRLVFQQFVAEYWHGRFSFHLRRFVRALGMRIVTVLLILLSAGAARSQGLPLDWRGISLGMSPKAASDALRAIGLVEQHTEYGGRQAELWEGTLAAFPLTGHCSGRLGQQCEEAFLSLVKFPNGDERVWIISTHIHLQEPALVSQVIDPAIAKYGRPSGNDFYNRRVLPNGVNESGSFALRWNSDAEKNVSVAFDFYPWVQSQVGASSMAPISIEAHTLGMDVTISDKGIMSAAKSAYLAQERNSPPPVHY